jgi:hypothetical protein
LQQRKPVPDRGREQNQSGCSAPQTQDPTFSPALLNPFAG